VAAGVVILAAVAVGLFRVAANMLPRYHNRIERQVSAQLGMPVHMGRISLNWHGLGPALTARRVRVIDRKTGATVLSVRRVRLDFSLFALLHGSSARPSAIRAVAPRVTVVQKPGGGFAVPGLALPKQAAGQGGGMLGMGFSIRRGTLHLRLAGKPRAVWTVAPIDVRVGGGRSHSVSVSIGLPDAVGGGTLRAAGSVRTQHMNPAAWRWDGHVALDRLDLGPLGRLLPASSPRLRGALAFDGGANGVGANVARGSGRLTATGLASGNTRVPGVQTRFSLSGEHGIMVKLEGTRIVEPHRVWMPGTVTVARDPDRRWHAEVANLELAALTPLAGFLPPAAAPVAKRLRDMRPTGTIRDLRLAFTPGRHNTDFQARLDDVSVQAADNAPGFEHLAATADIRDGNGTVQVDAPRFTLLMPHLFGHPVKLDRVQGTFGVAWADDGLRLGTRRLEIRGPGLAGALKGEVRVQAGGHVHIKLAARADGTDLVQSRKRYLPRGLLPRQLDHWLMHSLDGGRVTGATLSVDGDARKFPFAHGGGEFRTRFGFGGVTLTPGPGWVPLSDMSGSVTFDNAAMHAEITGGKIEGARIKHAKTSIPNLFKLQLRVEATVAGDAQDFLDFLRKSPAGAQLGSRFARFHASGPASTTLSLQLPIMHPNRFSLSGRLHVANVTAGYTGAPLKVTGLGGTARYDRKGPTGGELTGSALGAPVKIRLARNARTGTAHVGVSGTFPVAAVDRLLNGGLDGYASGRLPLRVDMNIPAPGQSAPFTLDAYSDLRGVAVDLPAPLGKPAGASVPLAARVTMAGRTLDVDARYSDTLRGCARVDAGSAQPVVRALMLRLGSGACELPARGIAIAGGWDSLALGPWLAKLPKGQVAASGPQKLGPLRLDLHFGAVKAFSQTFRDESVTGTLAPSAMRIELTGPDLAGRIDVPRKPTNASPIVAELTRGHFVLPRKSGVVVSPAEATAAAPATSAVAAAASAPAPASATAPGKTKTGRSITPRDVPPFVLHAAHLQLGTAQLDDVLLRGRRVPSGVVVDPIRVGGGAVKLDGTLAWVKPPNGSSQGALRFTGDVSALGDLLDGLGIGRVVTGHGSLSAALAWQEPASGGGFTNHLLGRVSVDLRDGGIAQVNPGAGRLLSLLAIVNIPRYLVFNFHNLFGKGFPFSRIHGDYVINKGIANTDGLYIDSSVANIKLVGAVNLGRETIDQEADIVPNYTGSLPIIGAIFGGLPVAAAIFAVTKIFGGPIAQMSTMKYSVKGPLSHPTVKPLGSAAPPKAGTHPAPAAAGSGG